MADQNIIKAIAKWGKDKLGNIIAYKTLTRCVFDDDGNRLSDILASGGTGTAALMTNEDAGVGRPDGTTIEVKENGIFGLTNSDYCQNINLLYSEEIQNCNILTDSTKRYLLNKNTLNKPPELNQNFILMTIPANENNIIYYQIAIASDNSNQAMRSYASGSTGRPVWSNWKYSGFVKYGDYEGTAIDANECISLNTIYNINNGPLESKNLPPNFYCGILFVGICAYSSVTYWQYAINFQNGKTYYRYATTQPFTYDSWKAWTEVSSSSSSGDSTIRYDETTDYIQVKVNSEWKNYKRAYMNIETGETKYIKFVFSKLNANGNQYVSLKELKLKKPNGEYLDFTSYNAEATAFNQTNANENAEKVIDNNLATKWVSPWTFTSEKYLQVYFKNGTVKLGAYNTLELYVGDDSNRIPISFDIMISTDGDNWTTIVSETNITPLSTASGELFYTTTLNF